MMNYLAELLARAMYYPMLAVLTIAHPFRKVVPVQPHAKIPRIYEWDEDHVCLPCRRLTRHRHIEWLPECVSTVTCSECGEETEVP